MTYEEIVEAIRRCPHRPDRHRAVVLLRVEAPNHRCPCGITWKQRTSDPGGPGSWYATHFDGVALKELRTLDRNADRLEGGGGMSATTTTVVKPWFSYDPQDGMTFFATEAEAVNDAMNLIDRYLNDTWDEDVEGITVGYLTQVIVPTDVIETDDPRWDEVTGGRTDIERWCSYELSPTSRWQKRPTLFERAVAGMLVRCALAMEAEGIGPHPDLGPVDEAADAAVWEWAASVRPDLNA